MKTRKQNLTVNVMESGKLSPLNGYEMLKCNFASMTKTEQTTDYCQLVLNLEKFDNTNFIDRI